MVRRSARKPRATNPDPRAPLDDRVWSKEILGKENVTDRCLRKWIGSQKFPRPDGNLNGRNFWFRSTYERWQADVRAGRYSQRRFAPPERPRA